MIIFLHPRLYGNNKLLGSLIKNFGGIDEDDPIFIESFDNETAVKPHDDDLISLATARDVIDFLEIHFHKELKAI